MLELAEIQTRLADYLGTALLSLKVLASGWETTVFEFATASESSRLPAMPPRTPLVLRFYQGPFADAKGAREHLTIAKLFEVGFCVPKPYAYEPSHHVLGAAFLIMERIPGGPLFVTHSFPTAFKSFSLGFFGFVRAQVRLHHLELRNSGLDQIPRAYVPEGVDSNAPLLRMRDWPPAPPSFVARRFRSCTWTTIRAMSWCRDFGLMALSTGSIPISAIAISMPQ
jgi:aminoglycoside phosphotransferase (APT) family kinase protein